MSNYVVTLDLKTVGSLDLGLGRGGRNGLGLHNAERAFGFLKGGLHDLRDAGGKFMGVLDGAAHAAMNVAKWGAIAAGGAVFGAAYMGVTKLNAELETTIISLGTIFTAQNQSNDLVGGFEMARDQIGKMRKDAARLPGELEDLQNIFSTGAIGAFQSGAGVDRWREISAKVMSFATTAKVPMAQAAREMAILMEGRSGAHNTLGMRLGGWSGDSAKKFNKMDAGERLNLIEEQLNKSSAAADYFARSYEGLSSTAKDNAKQFGLLASQPLFDKVKSVLSDFNVWFSQNESMWRSWADYIGSNSAAAFDYIKGKITEWAPIASAFFGNVRDEIGRLRNEFGPLFKMFEEWAKKKLVDPESIQQVEGLVGAYAKLKVASGVGGFLVSAAQGVGGLAMGARAMGWIGGGASAAGAGTAAAGAGAAAAGAAGIGFALPAAAVASVLAAIATPFVAAGILSEQALTNSAEHTSLVQSSTANLVHRLELSTLPFETQMRFMKDSADRLRASHLDEAAAAMDAAIAVRELGNSAYDNANAIRNAASAMNALIDDRRALKPGMEGKAYEGTDRDYSFIPMVADFMTNKRDASKDAANLKKTKGGHGGTTVQKVEIVVTSDQHPSRIARSIVDEMVKLDRNVRVSRYAR